MYHAVIIPSWENVWSSWEHAVAENNDLGLNKESRAISESTQNKDAFTSGSVTFVALCSAGDEGLFNIFALKISQITLIWKTASNHAGRQ